MIFIYVNNYVKSISDFYVNIYIMIVFSLEIDFVILIEIIEAKPSINNFVIIGK